MYIYLSSAKLACEMLKNKHDTFSNRPQRMENIRMQGFLHGISWAGPSLQPIILISEATDRFYSNMLTGTSSINLQMLWNQDLSNLCYSCSFNFCTWTQGYIVAKWMILLSVEWETGTYVFICMHMNVQGVFVCRCVCTSVLMHINARCWYWVYMWKLEVNVRYLL